MGIGDEMMGLRAVSAAGGLTGSPRESETGSSGARATFFSFAFSLVIVTRELEIGRHPQKLPKLFRQIPGPFNRSRHDDGPAVWS